MSFKPDEDWQADWNNEDSFKFRGEVTHLHVSIYSKCIGSKLHQYLPPHLNPDDSNASTTSGGISIIHEGLLHGSGSLTFPQFVFTFRSIANPKEWGLKTVGLLTLYLKL